MAQSSKTIKTGIDGLVSLVDSKGKVTFKDAAKLLGVSISTIEEWAQFLAEEKVIDVQYNFRNPTLVRVEFTAKQKKQLEENFKKDSVAFGSRLTAMTTFMDQLDAQINKVGSLIGDLDNHLENKVDDVKDDLRAIYQLEQQKNDFKEHMLESKKRIEKKLAEIDKHLADERVRYKKFESEEKHALEKEQQLFHSANQYMQRVKAQQTELEKRLADVKKLSETISQSIGKYSKGIQEGENRILDIKKKHDSLVSDLEKEYETIQNLLHKNEEAEATFKKKMDDANAKMKKYEAQLDSKTKDAHSLPQLMDHLIKNKSQIHDMIASIKHDEESIQSELRSLQEKSKVIKYKIGTQEYEKYMQDLHTSLDALVKKRGGFEHKIMQLVHLLHMKSK